MFLSFACGRVCVCVCRREKEFVGDIFQHEMKLFPTFQLRMVHERIKMQNAFHELLLRKLVFLSLHLPFRPSVRCFLFSIIAILLLNNCSAANRIARASIRWWQSECWAKVTMNPVQHFIVVWKCSLPFVPAQIRRNGKWTETGKMVRQRKKKTDEEIKTKSTPTLDAYKVSLNMCAMA